MPLRAPPGTAHHIAFGAPRKSTRAARHEVGQVVRETLEGLDQSEREILVLRGIEQVSNQEVSRRLGLQPSTATMRYQRALAKLEKRLPRSVVAELPGP